MSELQKLMTDWGEWSDNTFPITAPIPKLNHLKREVPELIEAIEQYGPQSEQAKKEFADCFGLILNAARAAGYTADDLITYTKIKLSLNKLRQWGAPDAEGVCLHIKTEDEK